MFLSVVIPTIGRSSLSRAVFSVLNQTFTHGAYEIIVVNDSGQELAPEEWQQAECVQVLETYQRERCVARNSGAAIARGRYLWFLDDDDWILPNAFNEFWRLASESPESSWLYGGVQIVQGEGKILVELNSKLSGNCFAQITGGVWAPIQSSIVKTDAFFKVGGFDPSIIGTEDLDLTRKISMIGQFANTEAAVACLFRGDLWDTSTNYLRAPADTRRSRDNLLDEPGAFSRLQFSANNPYWHGRVVRVYLSTVNLNLQQRRFFKAIDRGFYTAASLFFAGKGLFASQFWDGLRADHVPGTLHQIMKDLEKGN